MTVPAEARGDPLRLLMVEPDLADAELCVLELQRAGFDVTHDVAATRLEFVARLGAATYDIILADYRLPGWTGMDALELLTDLGLDTPLVLVTGTLGEERAVECMKQGVADYVIKDNLVRLPMTVRRALTERRARSEHTRADELIRKLTLAVDQSPASVIITDTEGAIEYVNQRFVDATGYSRAEALGNTPRLLKSGRTPSDVYGDLWRTIRDGRVWRGEVLNRRKSGESYWDSLSISPVRDDSGVVSHFLAIQQDVTEQRQAEQILRDREERFRQLAENIHEVFYIAESTFQQLLYVNPAYEEIWGRDCGSLYKNPLSFLDPVPPDDRSRVLENMARVQKGEDPGSIEFRVIRPSGEERWVEARAVPIRNERGEVYRISGVASDITERRRAQAALAESEARLRVITEASFDGIDFVVDGIVREANREFAEMFGYAVEDVIGRPVTDLVADESLDEVRRRFEHGIEGTYEFVGKRKDGKRIYLEATARAHTFEGRPGRITALRDVTEKHTLEAQFRQAQKMEAVGRLAGGVAHDFNNLLTVIMSYAELLLPSFSDGDPRSDDLEQIRQAAANAAGLTRQLLAFSRQQVIDTRPVALQEIVANSRKMLERLVGDDVEVVALLKETHSTVMIDPGQLEQVIMNLAVNARDAMPRGGKLTIETSTVELDEAHTQTLWPATPGRFAMLSVSDTGVGMDEETRSRIFEPFFTTKDVGKGTGLGLATVYGIVKQSGGFIWVYSEPGQGATFQIYLPLVDTPVLTDAEGAEQRVVGGTETVLVAEDAPAVRAAVRDILGRYGYTVLDAPSGRLALATAAKHQGPIHLLITDVVMPEMNGRELVERLSFLRPEVKTLYVSGYTDDAAVGHGAFSPAMAYLAKPFSPVALARKVRDVLDS